MLRWMDGYIDAYAVVQMSLTEYMYQISFSQCHQCIVSSLFVSMYVCMYVTLGVRHGYQRMVMNHS